METKSEKLSHFKAVGGFTLIELLVVISVIALLLAVMTPSLQKARERSKRLICTSNKRQIVLACTSYAIENKDTLHSATVTNWVLVSLVLQPPFDLYAAYMPYMSGDLSVWDCTGSDAMSVKNVYPYLNNLTYFPSNQRGMYGSVSYFPGSIHPSFAPLDASGREDTEPTPVRLSKAKGGQPMVQDYAVRYGPAAGNFYLFNHGKGDASKPSVPSISACYSPKLSMYRKDIGGVAIGFYDGSAGWYDINKLVFVGWDSMTGSWGQSCKILSVMPGGGAPPYEPWEPFQ